MVFDVDGTMTDGGVYLGEGVELKRFNVADGLGMKLLMRSGLEVAMITARKSAAVETRAAEIGIAHLYQGQERKVACLEKLAEKIGVQKAEIAVMGDDLPDLALFARCGVKLSVANGAPELRAAADWVSARPGGHGAVREAAELILKARGWWETIIDEMGGDPA